MFFNRFFFKNSPVVLQSQIKHVSYCVVLRFMSRKVQGEVTVKISFKLIQPFFPDCGAKVQNFFQIQTDEIGFQPPWKTFVGFKWFS